MIVKIINDQLGGNVSTEIISNIKRISRLKQEEMPKEILDRLADHFTTVIVGNGYQSAGRLFATFEAVLNDGTFDQIITDCPTWLMNDKGETIERIN